MSIHKTDTQGLIMQPCIGQVISLLGKRKGKCALGNRYRERVKGKPPKHGQELGNRELNPAVFLVKASLS
jgi:hypothetical protein